MNQAEAWAAAETIPVVRLQSTVSRTAAHRFYERLGYRTVKTQHSFLKLLGAAGPEALERFAPKVDR
jgi:hypothetical protein